jgi:hypothetical protein
MARVQKRNDRTRGERVQYVCVYEVLYVTWRCWNRLTCLFR